MYKYQVNIWCGMSKNKAIYTLKDSFFCSVDNKDFTMQISMNKYNIIKKETFEKMRRRRFYLQKGTFDYQMDNEMFNLLTPRKHEFPCSFTLSWLGILRVGTLIFWSLSLMIE